MADFIPPALKRFRASTLSIAFPVFIIAAPIGVLIPMHGFADALYNWRAVCAGLIAGAVTGLLYSFVTVVLNPAAFSNKGIYSHSFWGMKLRFLQWDDILQIRRFKLLNLTWLRIYSKTSKNVLWLPLFQSRPTEFLHEIGRFAPADSPIRNFLKPRNA